MKWSLFLLSLMDKVILINQSKTWVEALYYCRENHYDLVSITNLNEQRWVQERAKKANTSYVWLGLRYTCALDFWFWVNDEAVRWVKRLRRPALPYVWLGLRYLHSGFWFWVSGRAVRYKNWAQME
ncbi:snaclec stejaggregin-B subunit beta-1-like protein [Lates japonicus]|uniref:Snaclec stejaggregin-B subunit beta-1-like protein n=1 Tax=Lates japonicus TaxID=270547 RepID=A0AAD3MZJ4_LATJO|nr:snaclec stejaggregin-B subunit beta-1-like protein [Lates japonicus]